MPRKKRRQLHFKFKNLLIWLFLYMTMIPFLKGLPFASLVVQLLFTAVLLSAIYTIQKQSSLSKGAMALLLPSITLLWLNAFKVLSISPVAINILITLYLGLIVYSFGRYIFSARRVDSELLAAALCLYFLLGLLWGTILLLLEELAPGSFAGTGLLEATDFTSRFLNFNYLSFVTLTTLGYGDITPQTPGAMAFCQVEAILGQFFTAVLVARLVGVQVAQELGGEHLRENSDNE